MIDLFNHLDILNMRLQGKDKNLICLVDAVNKFMTKLTLWHSEQETDPWLWSLFTINVILLENYIRIVKKQYETSESKLVFLTTL